MRNGRVSLRVAGYLAVAALSLTPSASHAAQPIPETDPFFAVPSNVGSYQPGDVIDARKVSAKMLELPLPTQAWQVKYRTSDRLGKPTATVTTVIKPLLPWTGPGAQPLVSYQTAEDGVSTRCAPSYALSAGLLGTAGPVGGATNSYPETMLIASAMQRGLAVSVPDYEGLQSQFLVADVEAKGVLDGLRAARRFGPANLANSPVGVWGYSGGAFASGVAAQLQPSYAPELPMKAVALGGFLGSIRATIDAFDGSVAGGAIPMGMHGLDRAYPQIHIREHLNATGQGLFDATAADCINDAVARHPFLKVSDIEAEPNTLDEPEIATMLNENSPLYRTGVPGAPVYEYHATNDELAPIGPARATLRKYCEAGVPVEHVARPIGEHLTEVGFGASNALTFLTNRFAGKPFVNTCGSIP
ncbi:MAG: lipase family protein [Aeromicrobium sp.]